MIPETIYIKEMNYFNFNCLLVKKEKKQIQKQNNVHFKTQKKTVTLYINKTLQQNTK